MIFDELKAIQRQFGYLPADKLEAVSRSLDIPLSHIHSVASFYPHFHLKPAPKVIARVCVDMSCHLRGADALKADLQQRYRGASETDVLIGDVSCLGQCDGAPAFAVNDHYYRNVTAGQADDLIKCALGGSDLPEVPHDPKITGLAADPYPTVQEQYGAVRKLVQTRDYEGLIKDLEASGLAGLGGAGFRTGLKWKIVRGAPGDVKYVVCNADESEPGTIKDRYIMHHMPHLVIEGMILAGLVTGAKEGVFYIRHEYPVQEHILQKEIERCYHEGILGDRVCGSDLTFHLKLFVSPGGYICGEETALIEAIEGKRSEPRNKPPFPVIEGLWHKPTALNNVETFANVPQILMRGLDWYKAAGVGGSHGLKVVGVSGDVNKPGIFLIPMGTLMSEVLFDNKYCGGISGGRKLKAFAPSGPSSGYLPASLVDVRIDFKPLADIGSMMGSGAIVVCGEGTCMLDMAYNAVRFFKNESCGKCVPCRMGSQKLTDILYGWTQGKGTPADLDLINELSHAMMIASICGLGQFAPMPLTSVLTHFHDEVVAHVLEHRCPEGVCPMGGAQ